ncbi:MAG: S1/P1 Nuclease [Flavobacteriales bacterium]|nr:S1/P1 Nuclease [Flavobacteriales bacterium]
MRSIFIYILLALICIPQSVSSNDMDLWGFFGHKRINRMAVFTLPPELFGFFKRHIEFITEHAVDPDKRRYAVEGEAPRHYIDIDHYAHGGQDPFEVVPKQWTDAVELLTEDTLQAYGIVPWHVNLMVTRLSEAMRSGDSYRILRTAADLGHYVGDAHVPLHTTENYNGQLTGQKGIHGFWESRVVELFADEYDYFVGKAEYIPDVLDYVWTEVEKSHRAVDSVLTFERTLDEEFGSDKKYGVETRGSVTIQTYSRPYSKAYSDMLDGMIERRMRRSIISLGSLWYTAWVDAGQPDLEKLAAPQPTEEQLAEEEELNRKVQEGKIKGREHPH